MESSGFCSLSAELQTRQKTLVRFPELVELAEAMAVDDLLQVAVGVVENAAAVVEDHHLAVLRRIGLPGGKCADVGIAVVSELCPCAAHDVGQLQVVVGGVWELVGRVVQGVKAEFQFVPVYGSLIIHFAPTLWIIFLGEYFV